MSKRVYPAVKPLRTVCPSGRIYSNGVKGGYRVKFYCVMRIDIPALVAKARELGATKILYPNRSVTFYFPADESH